MWDLVLLALGLVGLWLGTSSAVAATVALGERRGLSHVFLGLTVLAIGTDLPELIVAIDGALLQIRGVDASGVVVGNAVGSAIAQGSVVLGAAALVGSIDLSETHVRRDGIVLLLAIGLLGLLAADGLVTRVEGTLLTSAYVIYLGALLRGERVRDRSDGSWGRVEAQCCMRIAGGLLIVLLSAEIVIAHAIALSDAWGLSRTLVGILFVGAGTSIPELTLSLRAAWKGAPSLAVGNVIGSNIFDLLLPIGASSLIYPLRVARETLSVDLPVMALVSIPVLVWASIGSRLGWIHASALLGIYVLYAGLRLVL